MELGYDIDDFSILTAHIERFAPVIIHFNINRDFISYLKDDSYKNQFETGISGGKLSSSHRIKWEKNLFGK